MIDWLENNGHSIIECSLYPPIKALTILFLLNHNSSNKLTQRWDRCCW